MVDLLDCDVRFGQGFLFSPPRPVRAEALQGIADRGDVVARDIAAAEANVRPAARAAGGGRDRRQLASAAGLAQLARAFDRCAAHLIPCR